MPQKPETRDCLSAQDQAVLDSVFNPIQIGGDAPNIFDPEIAHGMVDSPEMETSAILLSKKLELESVKIIESNGDMTTALKLLEESIQSAPERPSPYNNRAQFYRLQGNDDAALNDLNKAILLATETTGRTKCLALCQRGVLLRKRQNTDAARCDFEEAANLGCKFAKAQLVEINPYAALCNQMLAQVFQRLTA